MDISRDFYEASPLEIPNVHKLIGKDWLLITAKDGESANAMTASWGALGELWGKHIAVCFVRPQRYTFSLLESQELVSLAFLGEEYRDALKFCGSHSGSEGDKIQRAGLSFSFDGDTPVINEANMLIIGKKLYADGIKENCFTDKAPLEHYAKKDFHKMYIFEIKKVLIKK